MSKLPMVNFKTMDKLLHRLGFTAARQKGSHVFYRLQMAGQPPCRITATETSPVRSCARY